MVLLLSLALMLWLPAPSMADGSEPAFALGDSNFGSNPCVKGQYNVGIHTKKCIDCPLTDLLGGKARKFKQHCISECNECLRAFEHPELGKLCWAIDALGSPPPNELWCVTTPQISMRLNRDSLTRLQGENEHRVFAKAAF